MTFSSFRMTPHKKASAARRGAMLPLISIVLPILIIFLGFAVDLAYMQTTRMQLLAASDAAARAGAARLSLTDDQDDARNFAIDIAGQNEVAGNTLTLRPSDVQIGKSTRSGSSKWVFTNGGTPANSVRVTGPRNRASKDGPVPLFFGRLIGTPNFQPVQISTASFLNVDICLVLDRSTSMKLNVVGESGGMTTADPRFCRAPGVNSRWLALDGAVKAFVSELNDSDALEQVALASYAGDAGFKMPCGDLPASRLDSRLSTDLRTLTSAMDGYRTSVWNGNTYIEAGLRTGLAELQSSRTRSTAEKVIILMTDGRQNIGNVMDAAAACEAAQVTVHTVSFSTDADKTLMKQVADLCGGKYYHADDAAELRAIFRELAAQNTVLTE